jgi:hypothetical protein
MGSRPSNRSLLLLLISTIPAVPAGHRFGNQGRSGYALSCLSVNCQMKWDPHCCSGAQQGIGRSIQPLANWRFGSIFRNSIPPVRPYNPPTFEDIFETDHQSEKAEDSTKNPQRFSLNLNPNFGMHSSQQQSLFKYSNKFDGLSEMDRNSGVSDTTNGYFKTLNKLKEKQQQMLFGNRYETSTKPYKQQITSTKKYDNMRKVKDQERKHEEELKKKLLLEKKKEDMLEKQRLKSQYIKSQQAKSKLKKLIGSGQTKSEKSHLNKTKKEESRKENDFKGQNYQTNFNTVKRQKIRKEVNEENGKTDHQKAYEDKLARWEQKKAKLSKSNRRKYIDKSDKTIIKHEKMRKVAKKPTTTETPPTTSVKTILPIAEEDIILTEILSKEEGNNEIENFVKKEEGNVFKEKENQDTPFTEALCEKLRVPCRFVTEHPCCRLPQRIELVGRARAMDGSADLRWRFLESRPSEVVSGHHVTSEEHGGPRDGPQGRMITGFGGQTGFKRPSSFSVKESGNNILYNHSVSKGNVLVPRYHYDGGPQLTKTILQQCWRLNYLNCRLEQDHPCCALKTNRLVDSLSTNLLDKWLRRQ